MAMSKIDDGGPVHPCPEASAQHFGDKAAYMGMSLRDYFAGQALAGLLANPDNGARKFLAQQKEPTRVLADACFIAADAMIAARKEKS